jgi:hypothetical protein
MAADFWLVMRLTITKLLRSVAVGAALTLPSSAMAANYVFTNIADTTGPFSLFGSPPALNNHGMAAFKPFLDGGGEEMRSRRVSSTVSNAGDPAGGWPACHGIAHAGAERENSPQDEPLTVFPKLT